MTAAEPSAIVGHSPLPWEIFEQPIRTADEAKSELAYQVDHTNPIGDTLFLLNAGGLCPATTGCGPKSRANAALIVRAVNSHAALVKAVRTIKRDMDMPGQLPGLSIEAMLTVDDAIKELDRG